MLLTSAIVTGLGAMYGLIALGFHITWTVSNTVNFAQGSAMMVGSVLGFTLMVTLGARCRKADLLGQAVPGAQ